MRKLLLGSAVFILAFGILSVSVLESASPRYVFSQASPKPSSDPKDLIIDYQLSYPGKVMPDHPLWLVKAARDRLWHTISMNPIKKAELSVLFSDKRLLMSKALFEREKPDLGFSTLTKAEKYLEKALIEEGQAREKGVDTSSLLVKIATASLKHKEVINSILEIAPEDAKPGIIVIEGKVIEVYKKAAEILNSKGIEAPVNPFDQ